MVLISFREWLHSYSKISNTPPQGGFYCSHLFQRVASFLPWGLLFLLFYLTISVLISFREWLHSYRETRLRAISTCIKFCSHLFQRVASFLRTSRKANKKVTPKQFSSLSESGFIPTCIDYTLINVFNNGSHLFQRVASFLLE